MKMNILDPVPKEFTLLFRRSTSGRIDHKAMK